MTVLIAFFPFADAILRLIVQHTYLALFIVILLEESGLPLPVPGDGTMMFAGYRVAVGHLSFVPTFLVMEAGTLIGATFLWWLGRRGGRPLLVRYGRYIHLDERRLSMAERWFVRRGAPTIALGRLIPGLRIATSFVAGVLKVPYRVFLPYVAVGSSVYVLFFMVLGLGLGRQTGRIAEHLWSHPFMLILAAVVLTVLVVLALWLRRRVQVLRARADRASV
ncbi:MAG: DedA family protein [Chloroflexota bacterium]|nr:MAG: DedA family protein [Chloroflexota bacterium]